MKTSVLGFGAMRLPMTEDGLVDRSEAIPMIHRALEEGVNYIDTAVGYCRQDSQYVVGEALKGRRDGVVVSTKNPHYDKSDKSGWWKNLENSLERLQVGYIDVYNFHGLNWKKFTESVDGTDGLYREMLKARDQELIRHICFSFHDNCDNLIKLIDTDLFDVVTLQYNLLDRSLEAGIARAKEKNVGVVVMGPVGGGRLGETGGEFAKKLPDTIESTPELALRFVLTNPDVSVGLSGMSTMQQVEENLEVAARSEPLSMEEIRDTEEAVKKLKDMADLYCTGCKYCLPCPHGVAIPEIFRHANLYRVYGAEEAASQAYQRIIKQKKKDKKPAMACVQCGECVEACPQDIEIPRQLKQAHKLLTGRP